MIQLFVCETERQKEGGRKGEREKVRREGEKNTGRDTQKQRETNLE